jgi:hypothetical protein
MFGSPVIFKNPPNNIFITGSLMLALFFSLLIIIEIINASMSGIIFTTGLACVPLSLILFREFIHSKIKL